MPPTPAGTRAISPRELDYLARLALNSTRKQIAAQDGISVGRVSQVVDGALRKLDCDNLIEAYQRLGWLKPGGRTW
jgi:DNA-binding CsgD family transcriptional regulator